MKNALILILVTFLCYTCQKASKDSEFVIVNLKCEYLDNPIGIDAKNPRLTWQMTSDKNGVGQVAFQIVVGTDSLFTQGSQIWDSGKIDNDGNLMAYIGPTLTPFTKYFWGVQIWDNQNNTSVSNISAFETGMMDKSNWKGSWITDTRDIDLKPAPYFRKEFKPYKHIKNARAYVAAAGLYELYINGKKIGNHRLDPMYTRFDRRTLYVTYDVTQFLNDKKNAIGVLLGNGWYNHQSTAVWYFHEAPWRARPKFCLDLRIEYSDGSIETFSSDDTWKTSLSPVIFNSIYTAEHHDARLEQPGWDSPMFDDSIWENASNTSAPADKIVAQVLHPIRNVEKIIPDSMQKFSDKNYVFDLGKNIAGVSQLKVQGERGTIIKLIHGELLGNNGHVDLSNVEVHYRPADDSDPFQTDIFILKGEGEESFMPKFNYKGFQYVEIVSDKPISLSQQSLVGYFMHSDVPKIGNIQSSNPTIKKIWDAGNNSYLSNLFGYPTDCPQREKNGWTGDAHIALETGLYSYDAITIYEKWMDDHRDEQQPNGVLPAIIPTDGWGYHWANGPDWTSTIALIPWNIYLFYGDTKILKENYDNIKRYVDHIDDISPNGLTDWGLGDWVPVKSKAPKELTSTAYYYTDALILSKIARLLGFENDKVKYSKLAEKIKHAFNIKYLDEDTGIYGSGMQTELSVPLFWGMVPDRHIKKVATNLAMKVEQDSFHIDTGILGGKAILNALSENGYADVAYKLASQETYPSWGWWIVNGATTFYENWDIEAKRDLSLNHIMFGEINAWYFKALGGIKPDPDKPGFKNVLLKPNFVDGLDSFSAEHIGSYGKIVSSWKKEGSNIVYTVTIPPSSSATVRLKSKNVILDQGNIEESKYVSNLSEDGDYTIFNLSSGSFQFELE